MVLFQRETVVILIFIELNRQATCLKGQEIIREPWSATAREMLLRKVSIGGKNNQDSVLHYNWNKSIVMQSIRAIDSMPLLTSADCSVLPQRSIWLVLPFLQKL